MTRTRTMTAVLAVLVFLVFLRSGLAADASEGESFAHSVAYRTDDLEEDEYVPRSHGHYRSAPPARRGYMPRGQSSRYYERYGTDVEATEVDEEPVLQSPRRWNRDWEPSREARRFAYAKPPAAARRGVIPRPGAEEDDEPMLEQVPALPYGKRGQRSEGPRYYSEGMGAGEFESDPSLGADCDGTGGCETCQHPGSPYADRWHRICVCVDFEDFGLMAGVHGFKGPPDLGQNGNFGFQEGVNWGFQPFVNLDMGAQIGANFVQSNFEGDRRAPGYPAGDSRTQYFLTGGLFHRALTGLQWGVVADWLDDDYYVNMSLGQIRGEVGYVFPDGNELGCWFTAGTRTDLDVSNPRLFVEVLERWKPTDLYAFFYRHYFDGGGTARAWGGFSGEGDGLIGFDFHIPLGHRFALESNANYLIPNEGPRNDGATQESWALAINFVWYPGRHCPGEKLSGWASRPFRPLLNVADNSTFMIDSQRSIWP